LLDIKNLHPILRMAFITNYHIPKGVSMSPTQPIKFLKKDFAFEEVLGYLKVSTEVA